MSPWLLILLMAIVLSPLSMLAPSRHQRGRMDTRLSARRLGLAMQLTPQEWPYWLVFGPPSSCPQYYLVRRKGKDSWCYWQMEPGQWVNKWREPCECASLLTQLQALPPDVFKVDANEQMLSVYWGERGGKEALSKVAEFLQSTA